MTEGHKDVITLALKEVGLEGSELNIRASDISALYAPLDEKLTRPILQALSDAGLKPQ